jgi:hypothetical protein
MLHSLFSILFITFARNLQGGVRFPTGGDSPQLAKIQRLNLCNSDTDGTVRKGEE